MVSVSKKSADSVTAQRGSAWFAQYTAFVSHLEITGVMPRELGDAVNVPERQEQRLAGWVRYQRRRERLGALPVWQRQLLEVVPQFSWDPLGEHWDRSCDQLQGFLTDNRRMPRYRSDDGAEKALAAWVHKQRHLHTEGSLAPTRVAALQSLPFKII
jgi:hypothetical protein